MHASTKQWRAATVLGIVPHDIGYWISSEMVFIGPDSDIDNNTKIAIPPETCCHTGNIVA
eukprot:6214842-Pleurochrysis_carterae.AAC.3